jgi:hypothetical protein
MDWPAVRTAIRAPLPALRNSIAVLGEQPGARILYILLREGDGWALEVLVAGGSACPTRIVLSPAQACRTIVWK